MAVHIAAVLSGFTVRVSDQTIGLAALQEPVDRTSYVLAVLSFEDGASFHQRLFSRKSGHGDGRLTSAPFPMAITVLVVRKPFQAMVNHCLVFHGQVFSPSCPRQYSALNVRTSITSEINAIRIRDATITY